MGEFSNLLSCFDKTDKGNKTNWACCIALLTVFAGSTLETEAQKTSQNVTQNVTRNVSNESRNESNVTHNVTNNVTNNESHNASRNESRNASHNASQQVGKKESLQAGQQWAQVGKSFQHNNPDVNKFDSLKLNEDAIRLIKFDFMPDLQSDETKKPMEYPLEKKWMDFKADFAVPKNLTDTTKIRKPSGYIRMLPYSIWTKFGEDPVFDVMVFGNQKKYKITWTINPFSNMYEENYGKSIVPSAGAISDGIRIQGAGITIGGLDFIGFIYNNFTKRGRMLQHNLKHANAWKVYNGFQPTLSDSLKFPTFYNGINSPIIDYNAPVDSLPSFEELPDSIREEIELVISQKRDSLRIEYLEKANEEADKKRKSKRVRKTFNWNVKAAKAARKRRDEELKKIEEEKKMLEELPGSMDDIYEYMRNKEAQDSIKRAKEERLKKMKFGYSE